MFYWIYDIPNGFLAGLMCIVCIGYTWTGLLLLRPWIRKWLGPEPGENEFVSNFVSVYGVFYGLMLGLIAVATYQNYSDVDAKVGKEVASITALYRHVSSYPEPARSNYQDHIRDYVRYVIEQAWPAHQQGISPVEGMARITNFQHDLGAFQPQTRAEEIIHAETLRQFNVFTEARTAVLQTVSTALPEELWYVVVIGAALNLALIWMFSIDKLSVHLVLSGILSLFVGLMLFFIAAMDNPFRGKLSITPEAYQVILNNLMLPRHPGI
ncbi:MAG: bestrophin-like domain [Methylobacter sp.]